MSASLRRAGWALVAAAAAVLLTQVVLPSLRPAGSTAVGEPVPARGSDWHPYVTSTWPGGQPSAPEPAWLTNATAGVYPGGLAPGYWLHSLRQGYIVLLYQPPAAKVTEWIFQIMVWTFPRSRFGNVKLVVAPYPNMPHRFAVLAWGWRLWLDRLDITRTWVFYRAHVDHGPEPVP